MKSSKKHTFYSSGERIERTKSEKDLISQTLADLKWNTQIKTAVNKTLKELFILRRS